MFPTTKYVLNSLTLTFPREMSIRRKANDFEDMLNINYSPPQVLPVPDELEPDFPRLIFGSEHGYSQIIISQINIVLNVRYSADWQVDIDKGRNYLVERASLLFDLLEKVGIHPHYCGLVTNVRLTTDQDDSAVLTHIANKMLKDSSIESFAEILVKSTKILDNRFFSNVTVGNFRNWRKTSPDNLSLPRFPSNEVVDRGIEIVCDFNDRYAYNEQEKYETDRVLAPGIINQAIDETKKFVDFIKG